MNEELRIRLRRRVIFNTLKKFIPSIDNELYIEIEETKLISEKLYRKVDEIKAYEDLNKDEYSNLKRVLAYKEKFKMIFNESAILFHYEDDETGAIRIKVKDFFENLYDISSFTGFSKGCGDLVLINEDLKYGVCIERYEYFNKLVVWTESE